MKKILKVVVATLIGVAASVASAAPFEYIRAGDIDGFGYDPAGLVRATPSPHTVPADTNGNGILEPGEYLPDLNANGSVIWNSNDNFDNRSAAEIANNVQSCVGCTIGATSGSKWTDISLSTSMPVLNFPDPAGPGTPNIAVFDFGFNVAGADIATGSSMFLNVVFGDYDVSPASVKVTRANGSFFTIPLTLQGGNQDGLIQAATATMSFSDVFAADGSGGWNGNVNIQFINSNEPYLAFDYAELSLIPAVAVPEPSSLALLGLVLFGLGWSRRKKA